MLIAWGVLFSRFWASTEQGLQHHSDRIQAANYFRIAFQIPTDASVSGSMIMLSCLLFPLPTFKLDQYSHTGNSNNPPQLVYNSTSLVRSLTIFVIFSYIRLILGGFLSFHCAIAERTYQCPQKWLQRRPWVLYKSPNHYEVPNTLHSY